MSVLYRQAALILGMSLFAACNGDKPKADVPPPAPPAAVPPAPPAPPAAQAADAITYAAELAVDLTKMTKDSLGIYTRDLVMGKGAKAVAGKTLTMRYTGWTNDGKKFDSSEGRDPIMFALGGHQVINGWDVGVAGMKVGGKRQLIIPSEQGYGPMGMPPAIPGGAVLIFMVELLDVK